MNSKRSIYFVITLTLLLTSCVPKVGKVKDFTKDELNWFKPFGKTDTVIYISEKSELDTIIFHKTVADNDSTRDLEQGFSNTNYLTVPYEFTKGSYHQLALMSDGKIRYSQAIFNLSKSSSDYGSLEIIFIGIIFNGEELKNIKKLNKHIYFFDGEKATYPMVNVEKKIKNFTFDTEIGVTNYTDDRNVNWKRKKDCR